MANEAEGAKIKVNRKSIDSLDVFEITEDELQQLEAGSPSSTILNFSIFALSSGLSLLSSLMSLSTTSDRVYVTILTLCAIGLFSGVVLLSVWLRMRRSSKKIVSRIRDRAKPD